ncbi:MAG: hypothetical protein Q8M76_04705, partial [Spirochaetaceae bacterium]|nr:hypothetical protein [Spirochaetaceae bacterium]
MNKRAIFALAVLALCLVAAPTVFAQKVKLTVWGRDLPDDDAAHAYVKALVAGFQAKYPDIQLDYIALGDPGLADKTKIT